MHGWVLVFGCWYANVYRQSTAYLALVAVEGYRFSLDLIKHCNLYWRNYHHLHCLGPSGNCILHSTVVFLLICLLLLKILKLLFVAFQNWIAEREFFKRLHEANVVPFPVLHGWNSARLDLTPDKRHDNLHKQSNKN